MQAEGERGGWTSLLNSKCKHCSAIDNGAMNFTPELAICYQIANQKKDGTLNFKRISQDGDSFFGKPPNHTVDELRNEPNCRLIHLAGR